MRWLASILQELVEQIAVGAVDFHAVKTSLLRVFRALAEGLDDAGNLLQLQGPRERQKGLWAQTGSRALAAMALGATGNAPFKNMGSEMRPTCQSCSNMRPPA